MLLKLSRMASPAGHTCHTAGMFFAIAILDHRLENGAIVHAKCGAKLEMKKEKMSAYEIIILRERLK